MSGRDVSVKKPIPRRRRRSRFGLWFVVACVLAASALMAGVLAAYQWQYQDRIYPGVSIAGQVAGGLTPAQITEILAARRDALLEQGLWLDLDGELVSLPLDIAASDPDLARMTVTYDLTSAVQAAYRIGRGGNLWSQLVDPFLLRWIGQDLSIPYAVDAPALGEVLRSVLGSRETPPRPARLNVQPDDALNVEPEIDGVLFDQTMALAGVRRRLAKLDASPIPLRRSAVPAGIRAAETATAFYQAQQLQATATPTLVYEDQRWEVNRATFLGWLEFQRAGDATGGPVQLGFNAEKISAFLKLIAEKIEVAPQDAKWRRENGRVVEFQINRDGIQLEYASTTQRIVAAYLDGGSPEIRVATVRAPANVTIGDANDLGIRELLGVGRSNFKGSPKNRRHNIALGVKALNGIIIAPNEEFSLLKALGKVDATTGYLPELVIKGDRTVPEFGGGLCQIGTTTFRAALRSGLPITKRQNHSFRVRYYDPPGMDATIYDPAPDFQFLNDTGAYILFVAEIAGDELVFSFYGTRDGRQVEVPDKATILSTIPSGPVRYIETDELKPGEKKLVEKPAPGGNTVFTYKVTYPDGRVNEQVFKSAYRPWAETWLVGKTPSSTDETLAPTTP